MKLFILLLSKINEIITGGRNYIYKLKIREKKCIIDFSYILFPIVYSRLRSIIIVTMKLLLLSV